MDSKLSGNKKFRAFDPKRNVALDPEFSAATSDEIRTACEKAQEGFLAFKEVSGASRAKFLNQIADELEACSEAAIERAQAETGLAQVRLKGEMGRTTAQLRMFANLITEGSWVDARIDLGDPSRSPAPRPDLRRLLIPIGPVAVFGASNFPFAFSIAGGDTASALASGCTVVVKAHPAHPGTSELTAQAVLAAAEKTGMPPGVFSMVHGATEVGQELVLRPEIEAVAFTGSLAGGLAIARTVADRVKPIPVFAEMGSTNPIIVMPDAIASAEDQASFAKNYAASLSLGVGQFCTNPGIVVGMGREFDAVCELVEQDLFGVAPGTMLTPAIAERYRELTAHLRENPAVSGGPSFPTSSDCSARPMLFKVHARPFLADETLTEEVFGPSGLAVRCSSVAEILEVLDHLPGQLTATVHTRDRDPELTALVLAKLSQVAGRVIFNGFPTGVEVSAAMQHGGPFPATLDSKFTSVGTASIFRFARPVAFQNVPDQFLPLALQESNPLGIRRMVNGKFA